MWGRPSGVLIAVGLTFAAAAGLALGSAPSAQAAQSTCTPDSGYTECVAISYSGADQTFTLPGNAIASNVLVKLWGAGGGGIIYSTMNGGAGGYTSGVLDLSGNRTVTAIVGGGGKPACSTPSQTTGSGVSTYGGGGASAPLPPPVTDANDWYCGASGGGRSAIRVGNGVTNSSASNEVLTAGGGGGTSDGTGSVVEQAGPGGGLTGTAGACSGASTCPGGIGGGGTQSSGGAAGLVGSISNTYSPIYYNQPANGSYGYVAATAGTQFQGGMSGDGADAAAYETGGGGGGGYFGGGGGGLNTSPNDAPGGGGSGHVDSAVTGGTTLASTNYTPLGISQPQYVAGVGVGGGTATTQTTGGNGLVVFQYNLVPPPTVPSAPTNVQVATASQQATVSFSPPTSDGGSSLTGYTATATNTTDPSAAVQTVSSASSPITITGLLDGDTYSFVVAASNAVGTGVAAAAVTATLPASTRTPITAALAETGLQVEPAAVAAGGLLIGGVLILLVARRRRSHL